MKKLILRNFLIVLILTFATSLSLFAEGSKDLFPNLCPGYRAMLSSSNTAPVNYAHIVNHGKMFVYAKNGEMIYIGSSALGNADSVRVTDPNGVVSIHTGIVGRINNRSQELIGPATLNVGGYDPIVKSVTSLNQGVWTVEFLSSNPNADLDGAVSNHNLLANASWDRSINQPLASSYILAWDITVANGATAIPGRVFMNVFTGSVGGGSTHSLYSSFYVLTNDGYRYKFSCNGLEPWAFAFFSNNKGLENSITGLPVFISAANANIVNNSGPGKTYSFKDPTSPDDASNITHKLFYNAPSPDMPTTATGFQNGSSQQFWLYNTPQLATATNIDVTGIEGASFLGTGALAGAIISFTTNSACRYEILIDANNNGLFTDAVDIKLAGDASAGLNKVNWDGKDGNGVVLSSSNTIKVKVNVFSAEVHFPLIDAETNQNGIKLQQMIDNDSTIYWNDTPLGAGGSNHSSIGVNSSKGAHNWSTNFGDIVTIDTWAYSLNPSATFTKLIQRQETDLETVSISKVPTILCSGGNVTYTVVVRNNGPDNASGAKFKFSVPARMIINSVSSVITGTGSSVSTSLPGSVYDATVNLNNGSTITYTIGASDTGGASVTATAKASMLRATNVTDPDATNPDSAVPTDPDDECNSSPSGVGCNNIKTTDLTISNSAPTFTVFASPTTCVNTLVTYTTQSSQSNYVWTLSGTAGVDYQISSGGVGISSNSVTLRWLTSGSKAVSVSYDGSCSGGSASSTTNVVSLPSVYNVTGGGSYCSGSVNPGFTIGLSGSQTGVSYQLYNGASPVGSALTGTGSPISFGTQNSVGTYTVVATNTSTCSQTMSGSATITMNTLPTLYNVTGGGSYCSGGSGVSIGLSNSQTGVSYQLYNGVSPVGTSVPGTGSAISFGLQTSAGIYTVIATNVSTCSQIMNGSATVTVNMLPTTYTVTGGGSYCSGGSGLAIGLNGSQVGVNYQLYKGASPIGSYVSGTGSAISFGLQTSIGTYTVVATNGSGCTQTMSGSAIITINSLPVSYVVSGGGSYCAGSGGLGLGISLSGSELGVSYRLYNGASLVGGSVSGTGSALSFGNYLPAGTYTVIATNGSGCTQTMSGSAVISINSLPTAYTVTGGGSYCAGSGGSGLAIGLNNSELGVSYRLYQGGVAVGSSVSGTGSFISFGSYLPAGTYSVIATNGSGCTRTMSNSVSITINSLPTAYTVTGGGSYCAGSGGLGLAIGLSSSDLGVSYRLYQGGVAVGSSVSGTGSAISFGSYLPAGTYTVIATNGSGCTQTMSGSASININPLPTAYTVSSGGSYCAGGSGVLVSLSNSQTGVSYQLYLNGVALGSPLNGTGSSINFGNETSAGTYTVIATNGSDCSQTMTGSAVISINSLPTAYTVSGSGSYCSGGSGISVSLSNSQTGISYQLYLNGVALGSPLAGSGSAISFGNQTSAGTYTVVATNGSGCTQIMTGSAVITINALPTVYSVSGGGSYCSGGSGVLVGLSNSQVGVSYQLYLNGFAVGTSVAGTGSAISFGSKTSSGTYTVVATNGSGCTQSMSGSAVITINSLPISYTVIGGGSYCAGFGGSGLAIGLSNSDLGVSYRLYQGGVAVGSLVSGTGSAISFGSYLPAGTYTAIATNGSGCTQTMSGSAVITINSLPTVYTVTGGGSYCAGSGGSGLAIGLSNSELGVSYRLYQGGVAVGTSVTGTGSAISFGSYLPAGTYTAIATNGSGCTQTMSGSAVISINSLPTAYTVTGGGSYCAGSGGLGLAIGLSSSDLGVSYRLYQGGVAVGSSVSGTGSAISFGSYLPAGTYTAIATNGSGCTQTMSGSAVISINSLPTAYTVIGGGSYCAGSGGSGLAIGLSNSELGVSYRLYQGAVAVGSSVSGTGSFISFGSYLPAGTYSVIATNGSGCTRTMSNSVSITINSLPTAYTVTGGGSYCAGSGGLGLAIGLSSSDLGVSYRLYQGGVAVGSSVSGTGSAISFGSYLPAGTYTVVATNGSGCTQTMSGSASININPLPTAYTVSSGGSYCAGGSGVLVSLSNSQTGVSYQLYLNGVALGSPLNGTGSSINFGNQTSAGTYTVIATNGSGCSQTMTGSAVISINSLPTAYTVSGSGSYCSGGSGISVSLSNSQTGISYQLYLNGVALGSPLAGSGSAISFGNQTSAGTYTVVATNGSGCTQIMTGSAVITINALPTVYSVSGGGSYCSGGSGVLVGLSNSQVGVSYQLYLNGFAVGTSIAGTGSAISFGSKTSSGTYTIVATNGSGCTQSMSGSAVITINSLPISYTVIGGGSYCSGGSGVSISLSNSQIGVSYQLYLNGVALGSPLNGTGSSINFGNHTSAGTYTVIATNGSGCSQTMTGSAVISINSLPTAYTVSGSGSYCSGGSGISVSLSNSQTGISYQLYLNGVALGSPLAGSGSAISFGNQTSAGTYTVVATNGSGCTQTMTGSAVITINALPTVYSVSGGGSYCSGGSGVLVGLSNSQVGVSYQLYLNGFAVGTSVAGTGSAISFGSKTSSGTYTVVATNGSGCTQSMSGSAVITINSLPISYTVIGGGSYCAGFGGSGLAIGLSNSDLGVSYRLYQGGVAVGSLVSGTGSAISFGSYLPAGTYTVIATNSTGCTQTMSGSAVISINSLPTAYTVTGGGSYCAGSGGLGLAIGLSSSDLGVSYRLYQGGVAVGSSVSGTGSAISFGSYLPAGTYTAIATNGSGCTQTMSGSAVISINSLPTAYTVTGGGSYCAGSGGSGLAIGLNNSELGVSYRLYQGGVAVGSSVSGTGSAISFGSYLPAGTYTVVATNGSGCTQTMSGSASININPLPTAYTVSSGGSYCAGGSGVLVSLSNSQTGVSYQLYLNGVALGSPLNGTGSSINFGNQTSAGTYTVIATNGSGCSQTMTGSAVISINSLPTAYTVSGSGSYCSGGSGISVSLSNSQTGISYQLYLNGVALGSPLAGSGSAISFGNQTSAGTYTVVATNGSGCTQTMTGSAVITINALPTVYSVSGGGSYCSGGSGVLVGLSNSQVGVSYQLYLNGFAVGTSVAGTGSAISFGSKTSSGTYTVVATNGSGCTQSMSGSAVITINSLPISYTVIGGGSYCSGGSGVSISLSNSQIGVSYQLYLNGVSVGTSFVGTGSSINFGNKTSAGTYTVIATNGSGCTQTMTGNAVVAINSLPTSYTVTGGGSYCVGSGGSGLAIGLSNSELGVSYRLYQDGVAVGTSVTGTGSAISFGSYLPAGTYTVIATNGSGCTQTMINSVSITINSMPTVYTVSGSGSFCSGSTGISVNLSNSQAGVIYQLYLNGVSTSTSVAGTGSAISFGNQTIAGTYTVVAINGSGCSQAMNGSAIITKIDTPSTYFIVGGGSYCTGGSGVDVGLTGSQVGVSYQLYWDNTAIGTAIAGTGSALSFGKQTVAGTYTVVGTNALICSQNMIGNVKVTVVGTPTIFNITGGGGYCLGGSGVPIGLSNSQLGINYQLYLGGTAVGIPVSGTGAAISFGNQMVSGTYTVVASNALGCSQNMFGSATVSIVTSPKVYNVSGGGSYCVGGSGVAIGLDGSQVGMSYQLYLGLTAVGSPITGTGSAISFGFKAVVGNYSVVATNAGSCSQNMNGIAVVTTTALPVSFNVTGGGSYCTGGSGVPVGLSGSQLGYTYQLYLWGSPVGTALNGTGFAISFGNQSIPGNYTVVATNPTSCTQTMTGSAIITIVNMPTDYNVTGGGSYCAGGSGVPIGLDGSQSGVNYQLYRGLTAVGSAITGTGSAISFGLVTTVGTYTIVATNAGTCSETMIGNAVVTTTALPGIYNVTGGGSYCIGGSGVTIGLDGSQTGISYSLYRTGVNLVTTVSGTGSAISFGAQTTAGTYTVVASNVTSCTQAMAGSTTVTVVALPTVYSVTGGGSYCSGSGAVIGLNGSQVGVSYQLYQGTTAIGSVVTGTGSAISFGAQTTVGNYTVVATNSTGCTKNMTGSVDVSTSTLPSAYTVTGGGNYCAGGTGVLVGLSTSESGVNYQLYVGTISVGSAVVGTGSAISFGNQTAAGTYSVVATNSAGCSLNMSNSVIITITALPTAYLVVGGGNYCAGGNGAEVALNGSQVGVDYQLYKGTTAVGTTVAGTGSAISFGNQLAAGNYTVVASNSTGCTKDMTGSVSVAISAMPTVYTVTGGGSFYSGGSGVDVGLSNSELGVSYQLYVGTTAIGSPVSGTGSAISFGKQTTPGIYKVVATNATTCTLDMTGTVEVISVPIGNVIKTLKRSSKPVLSSDKKSFKWTYTITLVNRINQVVDSIHLRDDLDAVFKGISPTYTVVASSLRATGHLNINPNYNGSTNTDLLLDRSYLNANASDSVMIDVIVKPNGYSGVVYNTAYYDCITSIGKVKGALSDDPTLPGDHDPTPTVIKDFELFIPDGFSPNGDNTNDKFVIKHSDYLKIKIVFSNRWGNKVYSSDDYQNDWAGTGVGGNDLPTGTYYMEVFVTNRDTGEAVTSEMRYITLRR